MVIIVQNNLKSILIEGMYFLYSMLTTVIKNGYAKDKLSSAYL